MRAQGGGIAPGPRAACAEKARRGIAPCGPFCVLRQVIARRPYSLDADLALRYRRLIHAFGTLARSALRGAWRRARRLLMARVAIHLFCSVGELVALDALRWRMVTLYAGSACSSTMLCPSRHCARGCGMCEAIAPIGCHSLAGLSVLLRMRRLRSGLHPSRCMRSVKSALVWPGLFWYLVPWKY